MLYHHFRNYGCRLNIDYSYKGMRIAVLENEFLRVSILIDKGTDIFEFLYKPKDIDFMWLSPWGLNSPAKFVPSVASREGNFMDFYEGGWQEIIPNFGFGGKFFGEIEEGLHGEVCLIPWDCQVMEDSPSEVSARFSVRSYRTPFYLEKILTLKKDDPKLYIHEKLKNEGYVDINLMWTHHPAFGGAFLDESIVIDVPKNDIELILKKRNNSEYFEIPDKTINKWPVFPGYVGHLTDFSKSPMILNDKKTLTDEICIGNLTDGWYAVTNLERKTGFGMRWDKNVFPYIWLWRMYGKNSSHSPWYGRAECMALELCSSFSPLGLTDAIKNGTALTLAPMQEIQTSFMAIGFEKDSRVSKINSEGGVI